MVPLKYVPQKPHTPDSAPDLAPYCLRNHRALGLQSSVDTSGIDLAFSRSVGNAHLRYGASYYSDDINSERTDISTDGLTITQQIQGPVGDDATYTQTGLFAQWEQNFSDQIELIIGGRLSAIDADIGRYRDPATGNTASFSDSWQDASFGARASYALTPAHDQFLWASVSEAFRALDITAFHTEISDYIDTAPNRAHC